MQNHLFFSFLILVSVVLNTLGQVLLKLGSGKSPINPYLLGGISAYGLSTIFYIMVLGKFNLSVAYPVVIGSTIIATTISGAVILKEQVPLGHWLGVGLILSGISAFAAIKR